MPRAAGATAFESWTTGGAATAIGTAATAVWSSAAAAVTTAEGPLEARTRIPADARRIAWVIFAKRGGSAGMRSAGLSGQQDDITLEGGRSNGFTGRSLDHFRF
jgi:hypothetical protein